MAIETPQHIDEILEAFPEVLKGNVVNPANSKLFEIVEDAEELDEERKEIYHSIVAKLLWVEKRSRPDLETGVSFLTTRIQSPTEEDWGKLRRLLNFVKATRTDRRIIGVKDFLTLETWIDASHAIHMNMRGNTGGCMSLGVGVVHAKASKQKLNSKSSTETEVIGVSEYVPYKIQLINFIESQGYHIKRKVLYQDNQSAMRMEKNGRNSCTGNSRHISIRFFFVKDRVDKKEFTIEYCPTKSMLADYFTKPLQGQLFRDMRSIIMGWEPLEKLEAYGMKYLEPYPSKERVGKHISEQVPNPTSTGERVSYADVTRKGLESDSYSHEKQNVQNNSMRSTSH